MADPFVRKTTDALTALLKGDVDFDNDLILIFDASGDGGDGELKRIIPGLLAFETDAATALSTLGGQPLDASLTSLLSLPMEADNMVYTSAPGVWQRAFLSSYMRTVIDDANASDARNSLELGTIATLDDSFFGVEYFVDSANGNDANPGTRLQPVATINQAFTLFNATAETAVVVRLAGGTYVVDNSTAVPTAAGGDKIFFVSDGKSLTTINFNKTNGTNTYLGTSQGLTWDVSLSEAEADPMGGFFPIDVIFDDFLDSEIKATSGTNDHNLEFTVTRFEGSTISKTGTSTRSFTISSENCLNSVFENDGGLLTVNSSTNVLGCYLFGDSSSFAIISAQISASGIVADYPSGRVTISAGSISGCHVDADSISLNPQASFSSNFSVTNSQFISKDTGAGTAIFRSSGFASTDDNSFIEFRNNQFTYNGPFEEPGSGGMVSFLQFFTTGSNVLPRVIIEGNDFHGPIIGLFHGHSSTGVDAGRNTQDREIYIRNNLFDLTFAAEDGPEDPHTAILLRSRGIAVVEGNTFLVNTAAALNLAFPHNCIDQSTGTAGTTNLRVVGNYFEMTAGSALSGTAERSVMRVASETGGTVNSFVSSNTVRQLSTLDFTMQIGGSASTGTINNNVGTMTNLTGASTFQTAPTWVGDFAAHNVTADGDLSVGGNADITGTLTADGNYTLGTNGANTGTLRGTVTLTDSASGDPLNFGADVSLYRSAANVLKLAAGDTFEADTVRVAVNSWIEGSIFSAAAVSDWFLDMTGTSAAFRSDVNGTFVFLPITGIVPGTKISGFRYQSRGIGASDGVRVRLYKRNQSGAANSFTQVGSESSYINTSLATTVQAVTEVTVANGEHFFLRVEAVSVTTGALLYGASLQTKGAL